MNTDPSREQVEALNDNFGKHCAEAHPGSGPVVGLAVPSPA
jgi:hypothetical protein